MNFQSLIDFLVLQAWSLPSLLCIFGISIYITLQLRFVQLRYFLKSISFITSKPDSKNVSNGLTPTQAFFNTLGTNIGNGSLAGMSVAMSSGGPGAVVWLLILATLSMPLRFAEVCLGTYFIDKLKINNVNGGPMAYMSLLPGGAIWSYVFCFLILCIMLINGNLTQCNTVGLTVFKSLNINEYLTAFFVLAFITYIFLGGAHRVIKVVNILVPFKVGIFLLTLIIILIYHYKAIPHSLYLMLSSAINPQALFGGSLGFAFQKVVSVGFQQEVFASEAGMGTAAVAFGEAKGKSSVENGILAMLGVFINIHVVCFLVALCLVASGVWNNGLTSSALAITAYETVFGKLGSFIILFLVINLAISVVVASIYGGKQCWNFLFSGKYSYLFPIVYSSMSFLGTCIDVTLTWRLSSLICALALTVNLLGLLWSLNIIKKELKEYRIKHG